VTVGIQSKYQSVVSVDVVGFPPGLKAGIPSLLSMVHSGGGGHPNS